MTPRYWKFCAALLLLPLIAACGSTPPNSHYRLTAQQTLPSSVDGPALGVGPIAIPQYLARDHLVRSDGGNALQIASSERWAEPLEDGVTRVLSLNLAGLLDTQNIHTFPWHPDRPPEWAVKMRLMALDAGNTEAKLIAEWLLYRVEDDEPITRRLVEYEMALSTSDAPAAEIAAAYSELLFRLSQDVASAIRSTMSDTSATAP